MSVTITNAQLVQKIGRFIPLELIDEELEMALSTGPGGGVVTIDQHLRAALFNQVPTRVVFDVPDNLRLGPWHDAVEDVHFSSVDLSWSRAYGGSLRFRVILEEEGEELVGSYDVDIRDIFLDIHLVPRADAEGNLSWSVEADLDYRGDTVASWFKGDVNSAVDESMVPALRGVFNDPLVQGFLNLALDLAGVRVGSIDIDDNRAVFGDYVPPAPGRRVAVVFDRVDVHDDEDTAGSGELFFRGSVNGVSTGLSGQIDVDSGATVPLQGGMWRKEVLVPPGGSLSIHFEGYDEDVTENESLGTIDATFTEAQNLGVGMHTATSSNGDITLHYRVLDLAPPGGPPAGRRLRVTFERVEVLDDEDAAGSGELFFFGEVNGDPTGVSGRFDVHSGDTVVLSGGMWSREVVVPEDDTLTVFFGGYDEDVTTNESLGEVRDTFTAAQGFGVGVHTSESGNGDFRITYRIADLAVPPAPGSRNLEVIFDRIDVHDDQDNWSSGELFFEGVVNGVSTGLSHQMDYESGQTIVLTGSRWGRRVTVDPSATLEAFFTGFDADPSGRDSLGDVRQTFGGPGFGLGTHSAVSSNGSYTVHYRVVDPAARRLAVVFDRVHVHDDEDVAGSGELFFEGSVNGVSTGRSEQFDADSGDTVVLVGPRWRREVYLADGDPLTVEFSGFDEDVTENETLGSVRDVFHAAGGYGVGAHSSTSSNGDLTVHYRVVEVGAPPAPDSRRLTVRFERVEVHDDQDAAGSGELFFQGIVNDEPTQRSAQIDADSGTTVVLAGDQWSRDVHLSPDGTLRVQFIGYDQDATTIDMLGEVDDVFDAGGGFGVGLHRSRSSTGAYTLQYRIIDPAATGPVRLRVRFTRIDVHDDEDLAGSGELFFQGTANNLQTRLSRQYDARSGETIQLNGANWTLEPALREDEPLTVTFTGFDQDWSTFDPLGDIEATFSPGNDWGIGDHTATSGNGDYTLHYTVERAEAPPSGPALRVKFKSIEVHNDQDAAASGELFFQGAVNGNSTGRSRQFDVSSGDVIRLGGPKWTKVVPFDPDDPNSTLRVEFSGVDEDVTEDDSLGRVDVMFNLANSFGTNPANTPGGIGVHEVTSDTGDFTVRFLVRRIQ